MILKSKEIYLDLSKFNYIELDDINGRETLYCFENGNENPITVVDEMIIEQFKSLRADELNK